MTVELRRVGAGDAALLRAIRLRALAESSDAFAATLEEEAAVDTAAWGERAAESGAGVETVTFLALRDGTPVGIAGGRVRDEPEVISLFGMWVAADARGQGVGGRLVRAVEDWARARGARRLRLGVMSDPPGAVGFYERLGFACTDGEPRALRRDPARSWVEMARAL